MRSRWTVRILSCLLLLLLAGVIFFWPHGKHRVAEKKIKTISATAVNAVRTASSAPQLFIPTKNLSSTNSHQNVSAPKPDKFAYRLTNTHKTIGELQNDSHAILLDNALIDTRSKLDFSIPRNLQSRGDPHAYIVQAKGTINNAFRALLAAEGAKIISYIPNNAYLVTIPAGAANTLAANPLAQTVIPYEPYYKVQSQLFAFTKSSLPQGAELNLGLFSDDSAATIKQIEKLGAKIVGQDQSPFGPVMRVQPPENWTALAQLPGVQIVEEGRYRQSANDLSRVTTDVSTDTTGSTNYDNLTGKNVAVAVVDTGVDATHPDFSATGTAASGPSGSSRVFGDVAASLTDLNGHGTFDAGIIGGNGSESYTTMSNGVQMAQGSVTNADFRGKAPQALLYSVAGINGNVSDRYLQETVAKTNILISNNSWGYGGDNTYDLAAASYDWAVRDALSGVTGSQPVLFVFSAGNDGQLARNDGNGNGNGGGGSPDTITSPGTAKNVITVGALEQLRNITNIVTSLDGSSNAVWQSGSDSSSQVADYSSRGNVGIGTEGRYGRFKPDVVAPGSFVISTRSQQWDQAAYYNPTNVLSYTLPYELVDTNALNFYAFPFVVQNNTISVSVQLLQNSFSPTPFPGNMPIYVSLNDYIDSSTYDFMTANDTVIIPPNNGGNITDIQSIINNGGGFNIGVGNSQNFPVNVDVLFQMTTTNDYGNYFEVLSNLNDTLGPYYRYESGTSMSAADVSGVLALMVDYFTNTLHTTPSPALLKAMLINGARPSSPSYNLQVNNSINLEGWGLVNLPNSIPASITNGVSSGSTGFYFVDQNVTNALATGDSETYNIKLSSGAASAPLRITLAWTDPPGNPAAAIKLVNNLDLIVTNMDNPTNPIVYYGNDIGANQVFNTQESSTSGTTNQDFINNVENVFLPGGAGTNLIIVINGTAVNVNAVTSHPDNIVQDYALVISSGNGSSTNTFTINSSTFSSNPTGGQRITTVTGNGIPLNDQFVGASSPLLGTNNVNFATNALEQVVLGQTNQWHFYIWTNNYGQNAAFVTFLPPTASIPRGGAFASSSTNATRLESDIDLFVTKDPNVIALSPSVISNCVNNPQVGQSVGGNFYGSSVGRGGTEFVVDTNSTFGDVYYIGVQSEAQMASEYSLLTIGSTNPFSGLDANGNEYAAFIPVEIPDGDATHPGFTNTLALTIYPIEIQRIIITNILTQQNPGDLSISVNHSTAENGDNSVVLMNHSSPSGNNTFTLIYDDSGQNDILNSQQSDGPGSLSTFEGQQGIGVWTLHASDNAPGFLGSVSGYIKIEPHRSLADGVTNTVQPNSWFYDYIDVPPGYESFIVSATNVTATPSISPPLELFLNIGAKPTFTDYLFEADLTNFPPLQAINPGNSITNGPPLQPGRYWVGVYNPSSTAQSFFVITKLQGSATTPDQTTFTTNGPTINDDLITTNTIFVSATNPIVSVDVGLVVNHPRLSDLSFTLVSPTGQRVLLMENRGGLTATNAGHLNLTTNFFGGSTNGLASANTNVLSPVPNVGTLVIDYDFFSLPDSIDVYYDGLDIYSNASVANAGTFTIPYGPGNSTQISIVINQNGNSLTNSTWQYTSAILSRDYNYLTFTENTNLTTTPIKFAVPPFDLTDFGTNFTLTDFESTTNGNYFGPTIIPDPLGGWTMSTNLVVTNLFGITNAVWSNEVSIVSDPATAHSGSNYLALANGTISRTIPLTYGRKYSLSYEYRGPGISGWWRGEGDVNDSSDPELNGNNGQLIGRFNFPAGEVGQAFQMEDAGANFQFAGTNTYVQIRQSASLNVGTNGFTVEGWINPTNISHQQPLVEWLAQAPTNGADTNLVIVAGPFLDRATEHYYYLLAATNWTTSETWATQLGGHLATVDTANEENWIYDSFANYASTNRNLWIGLNYSTNSTNFIYADGLTNVVYTNWASGQPDRSCGSGQSYVAIYNSGVTNQPGLWFVTDDNGLACSSTTTNKFYGVVEVTNLQPNGVQLWISVTNTPGTTIPLLTSNGCLYANLVDVSNVTHEIFSAPGLIQSNVYQHVALTYNTNTGVANLYYNGTNVASSNLTVFIPKTTGDVLLGKDMSLDTNNFYGGKMDEMSVYSRPLSDAEIQMIYQISNLTTNRNIGKFDQAVKPAEGLAEAYASFGTQTNLLLGDNRNWLTQGFTFTATTNSQTLQFKGVEPGMLLDSFSIVEQPLGNLYYLPEQSLSAFDGSSAYGNWTLEIWDSRTGAVSTNAQLVSWQLQFVLQTNALAAPIALTAQDPTQITIPPGQTAYLSVAVPSWANAATNILVSATGPVDMFFNQTNTPTGVVPPDSQFLANQTTGSYTIDDVTPTTPPLIPNSTYYLGIKNSGAHSVTAVIEVDFNITVLSNNVPLSSDFSTNDTAHYYAFDVSSNAYEATFQLLNMDGNADLVVSKGAPLPTLLSSDYGSFNATNANENIYVLTNSLPVPLSQGRWFLGVFKRDSGAVHYTVLAKELDTTNGAPNYSIIRLTNGVPFNFTAGSGAALTNFFLFDPTNNPALANAGGIRFELYNLSGNGDLTVQTNVPPLQPPFFQSSQRPSRQDELIDIRTNSVLTNLNADWYLGVPDNETNLITYRILATIETNGVFAAFPGAEGAGAGALGGRGGDVYHVLNLNDDGAGSLRYGINNATSARTIVFDVSGTIQLLSPLIVTNSYLTIAGQTAPGDGVTIAGDMTKLQSVNDVVIRYVRFRLPDILVWSNGFEGPNNSTAITSAGNYFSGGWLVDFGDIDLATNGVWFGNQAYEGGWSIDLDGSSAGGISTNISTISGQTYTLGFAYARNPDSIAGTPGNPPKVPQAEILINSNHLATVSANYTNSWGSLDWQLVSYSFIATSSVTHVAFHSLDVSSSLSGVLLDAVSLTLDGNASDSLQLTNVSNVIADHISASWSTNENVSVLNSTNVTVQWSMIADSLLDTNTLQGNGSLLRYGNGSLTFHHNLYADNYNSSPRLGDSLLLDFYNNVVYNWGTNAGFSADDLTNNPSGYTNRLDYMCNYLIAGPDSLFPNIAFTGGTTNTLIFQTNNLLDGNRNGIFDGNDTGWLIFNGQYTPTNRPFTSDLPSIDEAFIAYERVLDFAGAGMDKRDSADTNIVSKVRSQTGVILSTAGSLPTLNSTPAYLDTDRDGIPDFWEITLGEDPNTFSANNDRDGDGYTDLEEYMNWLASPHALTVTNTSISIDLNVLCGKTGNLSFALTNAINGTVYLTNVIGSVTNIGTYSNSIAVFMPTNDFGGGTNYGFGSFSFYVTNNDTVAYFGPTPVSVMVSATPITYASVTAVTNNVGTTNGLINPPTTNTVVLQPNTFTYFAISAPSYSDFATNILVFADYPLNVWFNQNSLPTGTNSGDFELLANATSGTSILDTNSTTPFYIPGDIYYLGVQNTNSFAVTNFAIQVNFHLAYLPTAVTLVIPPVFNAVHLTQSNIQLQWTATTGAQVQVQWTTNLASAVWNTITNPSVTISNGISTFTDDGSQTAPLGTRRFYRLLQTSP